MDSRQQFRMSKVALIFGVTGQDGAYLAASLLAKGYGVYGTSRALPLPADNRLAALGVEARVSLIQLDPCSLDAVRETIAAIAPAEIYNLAGQTSVGASFEHPLETWRSIEMAVLYLLEAIRLDAPHIRLFTAGSAECFGNTMCPITELSPMAPMSPYAAAKAAAHWQVSAYRLSYGLHACTGFLFNHESPLREERFVTRKIVDGARRIAAGQGGPLRLGNLDVRRDWGWAPDYVEAMWLMLQRGKAEDYIIATGRCVSLQYFVELAFAQFGLDWREHVVSEQAYFRPSDIAVTEADPSRIQRELGWRATYQVEDVVKMMSEGLS